MSGFLSHLGWFDWSAIGASALAWTVALGAGGRAGGNR
jgi:hypothetical protein